MAGLQAHLTLVVMENGRVVRVEHAHLRGEPAARVLHTWPSVGGGNSEQAAGHEWVVPVCLGIALLCLGAAFLVGR